MTPTDPRAEAPESKPTTEMPKVPDWAIELTRSVKEGFKATEEHFGRQDVTLARLADESVSTTSRLGKVEMTLNDYGSRIVTIETRQDKTSMSVKGVSVSDEGQNMQIASLSVKVDELSAKTAETHAMLGTITGLLDKPLVKKIGYAAAGLALAALTSATGYFARGSEKPAAPTIIQLPAQVTK